MRNILFILISLLLSCSTSIYNRDDGKPYRICEKTIYAIAPDTPIELHQPIKDSADYWNSILGYEIFLYAGDVGTMLSKMAGDRKLTAEDYSVDSKYLKGVLAIGLVDHIGNRSKSKCGRLRGRFNSTSKCATKNSIIISRSCEGWEDVDSFETIVRHEMGHLLGLGDSADFTALMSRNIEPTMQHPVDANNIEIKAVRQLYNIVENK